MEAYENKDNNLINGNKKELMFHYYLTINGLIKVDKLLELMKESDLKVTKRKSLDLQKNMILKLKMILFI